MIRAKDNEMGRFSVEVELASYDDMVLARAGEIPPDKVRRLTIRGVVDTGATRLVIPEFVAHQLGLQTSKETRVQYADGRNDLRELAHGIHLTYGDRSSIFNAIVEPARQSALIGAIVMEDLDLVVDCSQQTLAPRDPRYLISEIE